MYYSTLCTIVYFFVKRHMSCHTYGVEVTTCQQVAHYHNVAGPGLVNTKARKKKCFLIACEVSSTKAET